MATSSKIVLTPENSGVFSVGSLSKESAEITSRLLQENHDQFHIFFNDSGFHNHIAHHLLTVYALGASPTQIQHHYDNNLSYQRKDTGNLRELVDINDPAKYESCLGNEKYYRDFLVFFQQEIERTGFEQVLNEYLLKGDERADDMLARMYGGFLHPIIHLGFGVEFKQPAIIAEALAQAAVHDNYLLEYFLACEKMAKASQRPSSSLAELLDESRSSPSLASSCELSDGNLFRNGTMKRAKSQMIDLASRWFVQPDELEEKVAEICNATAYFAGCAQHPPKIQKFDFFSMHCINASIFFSVFVQQPWINTPNKVKLLEWKGRNDLGLYVSGHVPLLLLSEITAYHPRRPDAAQQEDVIKRAVLEADDGHISKLIRALAHGAQVSAPFENDHDFRIKGQMWLQMQNMAIDSVDLEGTGDRWVRFAGFDSAWEKFPDRPLAQL